MLGAKPFHLFQVRATPGDEIPPPQGHPGSAGSIEGQHPSVYASCPLDPSDASDSSHHSDGSHHSYHGNRGIKTEPRTHHITQATVSTKPKKAALYNGKSSWLDYLLHFEMIAEINHWDTSTMAMELATSLRDTALAVLGDVEKEEQRDYLTLVKLRGGVPG
jgi:hypothetical protein